MRLTTSMLRTPTQAAAPTQNVLRQVGSCRRAAFTLVEILVVVLIIVLLVALTGAGIQMALTYQKNQSTKSDVNKLQQSLDSEYERVVKKCADDRVKNLIPQAILVFADGDPNRAQAIWTAMHLRRQLPENFAEATTAQNVGGYILQPLQIFTKVLGLNAKPLAQANEESGALLFIILTEKSVAGGGAMASDGDNLNLQVMATFSTPSGSTQLPTFKDAWGNSIGFHRWYGTGVADSPDVLTNPLYLGSTNQINAANHDPLDPRNLIQGWSNTTNRGLLQQSGLFFTGQNRLVTIQSPGQDKKIPTQPSDWTTSPLPDDVYGYQVKQYGK